MEAALAALGFGRSREDLKPISRVGIELAFRICDLVALGLVGWAAFFMRQVDDSELHFPLYLGAILLATRSEEHTSELQSLMRISYAVFCLKKKTKNKPPTNSTKILHTHHALCT